MLSFSPIINNENILITKSRYISTINIIFPIFKSEHETYKYFYSDKDTDILSIFYKVQRNWVIHKHFWLIANSYHIITKLTLQQSASIFINLKFGILFNMSVYRNSQSYYNDKQFLFLEYSVITYKGDLLIPHRQKNVCTHPQKKNKFCNLLMSHWICNQYHINLERTIYCNYLITHMKRTTHRICNQYHTMERTIWTCNRLHQHFIDSVMSIQHLQYGKISFCWSHGLHLMVKILKFAKSDIFLKIAFIIFRFKITNVYKIFLYSLRLILAPNMNISTKCLCISYSNILNYNYFRTANIYSNIKITYGYGCFSAVWEYCYFIFSNVYRNVNITYYGCFSPVWKYIWSRISNIFSKVNMVQYGFFSPVWQNICCRIGNVYKNKHINFWQYHNFHVTRESFKSEGGQLWYGHFVGDNILLYKFFETEFFIQKQCRCDLGINNFNSRFKHLLIVLVSCKNTAIYFSNTIFLLDLNYIQPFNDKDICYHHYNVYREYFIKSLRSQYREQLKISFFKHLTVFTDSVYVKDFTFVLFTNIFDEIKCMNLMYIFKVIISWVNFAMKQFKVISHNMCFTLKYNGLCLFLARVYYSLYSDNIFILLNTVKYVSMHLVNHNQNIYISVAQIFSVFYNHITLLVCGFFTLQEAIYISYVNIFRYNVINHVNDIIYNIFKSPGKISWPHFYVNILCTLIYILHACLYFILHTDFIIFGIFILKMYHRHGNFIDQVQIMYSQLISIVLGIFCYIFA